MKIVELQDKIAGYESRISDLMADPTDEKVAEAKAIEGRLSECRDMLMAEARRVQEENIAMAAKDEPKAVPGFAERVLGPVDAFTGIEPGWKVTVDAITGLSTPEKYDTGLPGPAIQPMGVLATLPQALTDADEHYFQQPAFTNNAAAWTTGDKAESVLEWTPAVAHLETIAHYIPIPKITARRYRSLESTVSGALLYGLEAKKDAHVVAGNNNSGIVGLANTPGIQTYTRASGDNAYDAIVMAASQVRAQSGFAPDCVAMSSADYAAFKTMKASGDGHYLFAEMVQNGTIDGLRVIIDENVTAPLVYFSGAATFLTADPDEVTIGLINKQFIQNEYTLLAEGTYALKVPFPKAICAISSSN